MPYAFLFGLKGGGGHLHLSQDVVKLSGHVQGPRGAGPQGEIHPISLPTVEQFDFRHWLLEHAQGSYVFFLGSASSGRCSC